MSRAFVCARARRRASSFASLPELTKKQTLSDSGSVAVRFVCVFEDQIAQVARVRVQQFHLLLTGRNHFRMTMTNMRDVVVSIEITPAFVVVEILHRAAHDVQRLLVRDTQITPEQPVSRFQSVIQSVSFIRENPWQSFLDRSLADAQIFILWLLS